MKSRFFSCIAVGLLLPAVATIAAADDAKDKRLVALLLLTLDVPYTESKNERQMLDVYRPLEGSGYPVVVWIHGGGWQAGSKADVQKKPEAFVEKGFVFVSTNYRLLPEVTITQMAGDVAKAVRWVHDHARRFRGDPNTIFVMGHSAGAQLAALVCTDDRYLKAEGLSLEIIKGCVPVDGDTYDVPMQIATVKERIANIYRRKFGDEKSQKDLSPVTHVAKDKNIPPFLILHVAEHPETKGQSQRLAKALRDAGVSARAYPAEGKNHGTINSEVGLPDDKPTRALYEFLDVVLKPRTLDHFKAKLDKTFTPAKAEAVFGKPDRNIGSGLIIYEYALSDGTKMWLGFPGFDKIMYAKHVKQDGTREDLPIPGKL
jgi:arylformamidase